MPDRDDFARLLDRPNPLYTGAMAGTARPHRGDTPDEAKYRARQNWRGIGEAALGAGDVVNDYLNAGIRDVGWLFGNNDPYQLPRLSEAAADFSAWLTDQPETDLSKIHPKVQQEAANSRALYGAIPTDVTDAATGAVKLGALGVGAVRDLPTMRADLERIARQRDEVAGLIAKPTMSHPVSTRTRMERPYEEMTSTTEDVGPPLLPRKEVNIEDVQGANYINMLGDRTDAGKNLTAINDEPFKEPVYLPGGANFMRSIQQQGPDQSAWASNISAAKPWWSAVQKAGEGGQRVIGGYLPMAIPGSDFASAGPLAARQQLANLKDSGALSQEAIDAFDARMRTQWGNPKKPEDYTLPRPDFPGIEAIIDDPDYILNSRVGGKKMMKLLDTAAINKLFPGIDAGSIRKAITDPNLRDVPSLSSGYSFAELDPSAPLITDPAISHRDYAAQMKGKQLGNFNSLLPLDVMNVDFMAGRKPTDDASILQRSLLTQSPVQEINQQVVDRVKWYQEQLKMLGLDQ